MARSAKVKSLDVVRYFTGAMRCFQEDGMASADELKLEVRRAVDWIQHDRREYWDEEVRKGWDRVGAARADLERCRTFRRIANHQPTCLDEKKALVRAKERLRIAYEKVEKVRHWARVVDRAVNEFEGAINQLVGWLEADLPRSMAALHRMSASLESYVTLQASGERLETPKETSSVLEYSKEVAEEVEKREQEKSLEEVAEQGDEGADRPETDEAVDELAAEIAEELGKEAEELAEERDERSAEERI